MRNVPNFLEPEYPLEVRKYWWYTPFKNKRRVYKFKKYRRPQITMLEKGMIIDGWYIEHLEW